MTMAMCCRIFLWCYYNKEGNGNLLPFPSSLCLKKIKNDAMAFFSMSEKKTMARQHVIVFFCGGVPMKKAMATRCHHFLLWWCQSLIWWFLGVFGV
jgi:hypothetical protein